MEYARARRRFGAIGTVIALSVGLVAANGEEVATFITNLYPYAVPLSHAYEIKPLLSVGDLVPETSHPEKQYRMIGIPDGLGAHESGRNRVTIYMNHELGSAVLSEPVVGDPFNRGAFVSKLILDREGNIISGERAYDTVFLDDTLVGPAAAADNATPGFGRFCSGFLAGPEVGFDRYIYFANEESSAPAVFDGKGGLSVAIFDNEAHGLTDLGRFPWENTLVQPHTGPWTVIMGMEDGPAALDPGVTNSQLYMYVGRKSRKPGATVLERNGLVGGQLYVARSKDPAKNSELPFQEGSLAVEWVLIPNADLLTDVELEAASDAVDAMRFGRPEDGAFNPRNSHEYFFVTTGGATGANALGRLYSLRLNSFGASKPAVLEVLYNADKIIATGGDIAISPDNIDVSLNYLMINEDGTADSRAVMAAKGRDGSIWRFRLTGRQGLDVNSAERVAELDPPGRDGAAVGAGVWETSGIIDVAGMFGTGLFRFRHPFAQEAWLFDVQAHPPTAAPPSNTVEDGQLLLMTRSRPYFFPWWSGWWW